MKHLSLETAQRLKAAGWPQADALFYHAEHYGEPVHWYRSVWEGLREGRCDGTTKTLCACPTTDELIHGLGASLDWLECDNSNPEELCFQARCTLSRDGDDVYTDYCAIPAEALAALWLQLHEQKGDGR